MGLAGDVKSGQENVGVRSGTFGWAVSHRAWWPRRSVDLVRDAAWRPRFGNT